MKKRHKRKKRKPLYQIVAELILEGAPFDISSNGDGWTKVQELVNLYRLRELPEADRYNLWDGALKEIEGVFRPAIRYINEKVPTSTSIFITQKASATMNF